MVTDIAIYLEGGGPTAETQAPFRQGMSAFLKPVVDLVRQRRIRWRVVPCGGRREAYDAFCDALVTEPDVFNILLVDSETLPAGAGAPWTHVRERPGDGWAQPTGADDMRCHMMVACMEAWLIVDREALKKQFKKGFDESKLPQPQYVETTPKEKIAEAMSKATKDTPAGSYGKIRDGAKLLSLVSPALARQHCKWCDRLFVGLAKAMETTV